MYEDWKFPHESLRAYQDALEFLGLVQRWRWCAGTQELRRQVERASLSIVLNLCEGRSQKMAGNSGRNFYRIALGSAGECHGALEAYRRITRRDHSEEEALIRRVAAQISGLL